MSDIIVIKNEDVYTFSNKLVELPTLPAATYKMAVTMFGEVQFIEQKPDNDEPIEIDNQSEALVKEIGHFLTRRDIFRKLGFSHKRGYILHGPPGCGKTTTLRLLQKNFTKEYNGVVLLWDGALNFKTHLRTIRKFEGIGRPVMVVCEDIDHQVSQFEKEILETLDGQTALNNFILVATTNYLADLPDRIRNRPSRIDRLVKIDYPSQAAREVFLSKIGLSKEDSKRIAAVSGNMSMAHLKEVVVAHICLGNDLVETVNRLRGVYLEIEKAPSKKKKLALNLLSKAQKKEPEFKDDFGDMDTLPNIGTTFREK